MKLSSIRIDEKIRSQTNTLILGSPGYGKSKFMEGVPREDLRNRQPVCFIDSHGRRINA